MKHLLRLFIILNAFVACQSPQNKTPKLPLLGSPELKDGDTIYPVIKSFRFINQDSALITNHTFDGKIYVADFIFLSCPSICPMVNKNLRNVYEVYKNNPQVLFLSHTVDTERDSVSRLKAYANNLDVDSKKWHFVTGNQDSIFDICERSYFLTAYPDSKAPGGYTHSGGLLLVDKQKHLRGVYDGTDAKETERLIKEIKLLLQE